MGVTAPCTTADEMLPDQEAGHTYWLGHRLADHEEEGGGDADLLCECELVDPDDGRRVPRPPLAVHHRRRPARDAGVGMGPCQGAFCTFRVAGLVAERLDVRTAATGQPVPGALEVDGHRPGTPPTTPRSRIAR